MTDEQKAIEASAPLRSVALAGQTYLISQPTISQNASISFFIQKRLAKRTTPVGLLVNDPAFSKLPPAAQTAAAVEAAKAQVAGKPTLDAADILGEMMEPASLAFIFWLLARGNHPGLRLEDIAPHITDANAAEVFAELNEASGMQSLGEAPGRPG